MPDIKDVNAALAKYPPFWEKVGEYRYTEDKLDTLQVNIGLKCNFACKHCHVQSSPTRTEEMEREYKQKLNQLFGISFDNLFTITNAPGGRFGERLIKTGNMDRYMNKLIGAFNADTVPAMMCRTQLSVSWDGSLYDCDFNQACGMPCKSHLTIADMANDPSTPLKRDIVFANHCYACTAGAGSS